MYRIYKILIVIKNMEKTEAAGLVFYRFLLHLENISYYFAVHNGLARLTGE